MAVTWNINSKKCSQPITCVDWTLDKYYNVAKQCIGYFAKGSLASSMLRDEDAISFVAEYLMYAAGDWRPDGGRTIKSFLNQRAIWAIIHWITISKRASKRRALSLNAESSSDSRTQHYELQPDITAKDPGSALTQREQSERLARIIDGASLTKRQRYCLDMVYYKEERPSVVARNLGVTRQAVDQSLQQSLHKLRIALHGEQETFLT
jgi:RNA polymerase sigma factor (sigma-70 family)